MKKIGIQGGEASYHEMAARQLHSRAELTFYETFSDLFHALREQQIDSALTAIANNSIGFIAEPYAQLVNHPDDFTIVAETYLRVEHVLLAPKGVVLEDIREVHSQSPALDQCRKFLETALPHAHLVEEHDTAGSAKLVADWNDPTKAAIASVKAGELYGLKTIKAAIQDDPDNITRFLEIVPASVKVGDKDATKTTMLLKTPERPGALVEALLPFKEQGINLSNLHSRIVPSTAFEMQFFLEFEAGLDNSGAQLVLQELRDKSYDVQLLGSYQQAKIPITEGRSSYGR